MTQFTTDRAEIEQWSEQHGVVPVREGSQVELVPEREMSPSQERIDWETFHRSVEENDRVVMYHEGSNERGRFEVSDQTAAFEGVELEEEYDQEQIQARLLEGETVTGTITETTVVTETVVEEATLESEIVERNYTHRQVTNLELIERHCQSCSIDSEVENLNYEDWGDSNRFIVQDEEAITGEQEQYDEYPYGVTADIEERWLVTIEEREEYIVETRISDVDMTETEQIDSQAFESHVNLDAVHDQLLRSIDLGPDSDSEVVDAETYTIDSEFTENDTIRTTLTSRQVIEKELSEEWRLSTDVTAGSLRSRTTHREDVVESGLAERTAGTSGGRESETMASHAVLTEDDEGKRVVSANEKIGMITEVDGNVAYVDPNPGLADTIRSKLGSTKRDSDDFELDSDQIAEITDDEVRLTSAYDEQ